MVKRCNHLAWTGSDYIYALRRAYSENDPIPDLWRYSILGDSWEALRALPERTSSKSCITATNNGIYVAIGGDYSELLGSAPSSFYFSSSPEPILIHGPSPEQSKASVHLYGHKTNVAVGEDIILDLSAVNLITNPNMTVQLILQVPSGMSVTSVEFIEGGGGQYTATYTVEPGNTRLIEVRIKANQAGNVFVRGDLCYYFAEDKSTAEYRTVTLPVTVGAAKTPVSNEIPVPRPIIPGFEAIFAIAALLAVVYLVRRRK